MSVAAAPTESLSWEGHSVRVEAVAGQLLRLRTVSADEEGFPLARASVMNLLSYASTRELADQATSIVADLAMRHPARAIVIAPQVGGPFTLDAEVVLHRHPLAAHGLVYERVVLRPRGASPEGLDTLVIPLLIPHLQSFVWWLGDPNPDDPAMRSLTGICDRLVVDTSLGRADRLAGLAAQFTGPADSRTAIGAARLVLGDMTWRRLEPMREVLARVFDEGNRPRFLDAVDLVEITSGTRGARDRVTSAELLFAGWICARLGLSQPARSVAGVSLQSGASGRRTEFIFRGWRRSRGAPGPLARPPLRGFRLLARASGRRLEVEFQAHRDEGEMVVRESGLPETRRMVPVGRPPEAEVLSHELDRMGRDRVYEDALLWAARVDATLASR